MVFCWRAIDGQTLNVCLAALGFFRGSGQILLRNPIAFMIFLGERVKTPCPPLDPRIFLVLNAFFFFFLLPLPLHLKDISCSSFFFFSCKFVNPFNFVNICVKSLSFVGSCQKSFYFLNFNLTYLTCSFFYGIFQNRLCSRLW